MTVMRWLVLASVLASLSACELLKLRDDLEQLYDSVSIISGQVESELKGQAIALLASQSASDGTLTALDYRFPDRSGRFNFQQVQGHYQLFAFLDQNGDFVYQTGEPVARANEPLRQNRLGTDSDAWQINRLQFTTQSTAERLPFNADVSVGGLQQFDRTVRNMGVPVDFNDPRFSAEAIASGMWEPSRWALEVGYGFYLTESWADGSNDRPLLIMVHGINGSPKVFEQLLEKLETAPYRIALYHYPSAMSIDDNAYVLSQIVDELLIRVPGQQYSVLAHSMGGLVAKRFIHMQHRAGNSDALQHFISISVPWLGHKVAETGLEYSPVEVPVWQDIAPSSRFIRLLRTFELPAPIDYTMLFSHEGNSLLQGEPNDGVVALRSQLDPLMQDRAQRLVGVDEDHVGILTHPRTIAAIEQALAEPENQ